MVRKLGLAATLGWGLVGLAPTTALAGVSWTWNPAGASTPLNGTSFTADNIIISDHATADIVTTGPSAGNFTEAGVFVAQAFQIGGGNAVTTPGLNSTYSLYATFTASGNQGGGFPAPGYSVTGPITSLTYTLWGNPNGAISVHLTGTNYGTSAGYSITGNSGAFALGGGTLYGPYNSVTIANNDPNNHDSCPTPTNPLSCGYTPTANATASLIAASGESGFYVAPTAGNLNFLQDNFSGNLGVTSFTLLPSGDIGMAIAGGGGNITSVVPEPSSVAVFAAGLLGLGWFGYRPRRRRG